MYLIETKSSVNEMIYSNVSFSSAVVSFFFIPTPVFHAFSMLAFQIPISFTTSGCSDAGNWN